MPDADGHKHAVILSGGGAYGAFEIGVLKALCEGQCAATHYQPIDPDIFTGTSVGAFNAAFMVSQPGRPAVETARELERIWLEDISDHPKRYGNGVYRFRTAPFDFLNIQGIRSNPLYPFRQLVSDGVHYLSDWIGRSSHFLSSSETLTNRTLALFDLCSFIDVEPLGQLVKTMISFEGIRRSNKILKIITTNWQTGEINMFDNADMTDEVGTEAILASTAIPGFFPPVNVRGNPSVDGGVVMNTPLIPAIVSGATIIHMIYLDPDVANIPIERIRNTLDTLDRMLTIQFAININEDIATVQWINQGLDVIERLSQGETASDTDARDFIRVAHQIAERIRTGSPYRKITVHRYHPSEDLGGVLGLLNFDSGRIHDLIERGYRFASRYDPAMDSIIPTYASR